MKQLIIILFCIFCSLSGIAQEEIQRIKTEATILEIELKRSRRYAKEIATVSYTTEEGLALESQVELMKIPILGSFKNVGDKIEIYYDKNRPAYIETITGSYITQYGMYILIILGIFFSYRSIKNAYK